MKISISISVANVAKIIKIGQLRLKLWLFFKSKSFYTINMALTLVLFDQFWWFFGQCHAFTCVYWCHDDQNGPGIDYKDANGKILMETLDKENSTVFDLKNYHNFSLSWPILMIFVANIILSHVLINIMMTRMVQA